MQNTHNKFRMGVRRLRGLYATQDDEWLYMNSERADGLFSAFQQAIMKHLLRERKNGNI